MVAAFLSLYLKLTVTSQQTTECCDVTTGSHVKRKTADLHVLALCDSLLQLSQFCSIFYSVNVAFAFQATKSYKENECAITVIVSYKTEQTLRSYITVYEDRSYHSCTPITLTRIMIVDCQLFLPVHKADIYI